MIDDLYYDRSAMMFLQMMQSGMLGLTLLLIAVLFILAFCRDRIARPRVFNAGAVLYTTAIVLPLVCATFAMVIGQFSSGNYNSNLAAELLGPVFFIVMLVTPLILGASVVCLVVGMLVPVPPQSLNRSGSVGQAVKPSEPHPLDD